MNEDDAQAAARRFVLEALRRQRGEPQHNEAFAERGKQCPIQRPMLERW
jgi:hypothetical protein